MSQAEQMKALLRAHANDDDDLFYSVALQIAAQSAQRGHSRVATELRDLIDRTKSERIQRDGPTPIGVPKGELGELLAISYPQTRLKDMVLGDAVLSVLERVLREQRQRDKLLNHGFLPAHRLLLTGLPGTGKSMTAAALAHELSLPLMTIRLDGVISRFLGDSASKLRLVFDEVARRRAVYFFDEFDALGSDRGASNDVGETRRILNSFLLFLDDAPAESLLVAATNHVKLLDPALFRRFDAVIQYGYPESDQALAVLQKRLITMDTSEVDWASVNEAARKHSHSDLVKAAERAAKDVILSGKEVITTEVMISALDSRGKPDRD